MRESPKQPKKLSPEVEGSLAAIGYVIEGSQDMAIRAEDFMNQISDEIKESEDRLRELEALGTDAAKKEMLTVQKMLSVLRKHYADAKGRHAQAEEDVARHTETRREFIRNLDKNGS